MTRDELLQVASQWLFSRTRTRLLAARMTTSEAVVHERTMVTALAHKYNQQSASAWRILGVGVASGILGLVATAVGSHLPVAASVAGAIAVASGLGLMVCAVARGCAASANLAEAREILADLTPIVQSAECKTALKFVAGGHPAVFAWRDLAIAERRVLYAFDLQIMRELHYASEAAADAGAQQRENEKACRQLYGIADQDTLPAELSRTYA